ncbi:DegT/DnrJ/EryC1/StrS family aminotransferase [bacterium]|nr:DegT/DnrJ/EryC1/StrS family aminotransferase [bacterium]
MAKIPLLNTRPEIDSIWDQLVNELENTIKSGQFIMGPNVKAFESEVAAYMGAKHAVGCNSGTDALVLGVRSLGLCAGDEVITTPFTFFATSECISAVGAIPVFVDIDPATFNIDVSKIEEKITEKTKAIIPVHLYGHAVDMDPLLKIAQKHGLKVLEDVAQAFGSEYKGKKVGTIGNAGAFSFFPSKNLGAFGDGGLFVTNDDELAAKARMLRVHGASRKYYNEVIGYNSRLDELQATILRVKLPHIDEWNGGRRQAAARYNKMLAGLPGVITPSEADYTKHVYHQYTIRILNGKRDAVQKSLAESEIGSFVYYPVPLDRLPVYSQMDFGPLPNSDMCSNEVLSLPIWPKIDEQTQVTVVDNLRAGLC